VLHARTSIEHRAATPAAITPTIVGVDRIAAESNERRRASAERALDEVLGESFDTFEVSRPTGVRTFLQGLVSFAGAAGLALFVPVAVLLVGLPVVLVVRGVLEVLGLLFGVSLQ
jgi:hypothetical protein